MVVRTQIKSARTTLLVLLALCMSATLSPAQAPAQDAGDWLPVTIVYNSDVGGKIEPCG